MPTVEDYVEEDDHIAFDDDTDIPLPDAPAAASGSSRRTLANMGERGALLSHIDDKEVDFDLEKIARQGAGIENLGAPPPRPRDPSGPSSSETAMGKAPMQPSAGGGAGGGAMGGIMGDLMKMQQAEEQRMRKLEKQLGQTRLVKDPEEYKRWISMYPIYFDAKASTTTGRRVQRQKCIWWPQSFLIAKACSVLGLETVHEVSHKSAIQVSGVRTHTVYIMNDPRWKNAIQVIGKILEGSRSGSLTVELRFTKTCKPVRCK